jgi:RecA-family ATPase
MCHLLKLRNSMEKIKISQQRKANSNSKKNVAKNVATQLATNATSSKTDKSKSDDEIVSFDELAEYAKDLPEFKKLFGNHILENSTVLFPSERGVGKTFLALQLAMSISNGDKSFLGEKIEMTGNTLYLNMELGKPVISKRILNLNKLLKIKKESKYKAYCFTERKDLNQLLPKIKEWVNKYKPVLLIVDNLRTAFGDSDNENNKEMTKCINELNNLRDKYCFALLLIHHTKKGTSYQLTNSDMQSGAGAISDLVDGDFFLRRSQKDTNLRILKRSKSRNCEDQDGATLIKFNPESYWFELVESNVDEQDHIYDPNAPIAQNNLFKKRARELRDEGKTLEEIGKIVGRDKGTISRWINT